MAQVLIIVTIAVVLAALSLAARAGRREPAPAPEPEPVTTVTAHVITAAPSAADTAPFAYDNGLAIDGPDEEQEGQ